MIHSRFFILFLLLLAAPFAARADAHVVIDTIQPSGVTADDEFIDLLNPTDADVTIGTWSIQYKSVAGATFYKKNFPSSTTIGAGARYRIAGSGYAGTVPADMQQSTISLATAGGTVFLVSNQTLITDATDPDIVDQKTYSAPTAPPQETPPPTPIPLPSVSPPPATAIPQPAYPRLTIDSFLADPPTGEKEWVMLMNDSSYAVELTGWTIADGTGKTITKPTGLILPRHTFKVGLSAARLNNDGDQIILRDPDGKETDSKTYGNWNTEAETNTSKDDSTKTTMPVEYEKIIARIVAEVLKATESVPRGEQVVIQNLTVTLPPATVTAASTPTPKKTAISTSKTVTPKVTTTPPRISGTVSVAPGVLWKEYAVVATDVGGVQIHLPKNMTATLATGDTITATGTWSTAQTLPLARLLPKKATDIVVTGHNEVVPPTRIPLGEIDKHIGEIIETTGPIVERQQKRVRIAQGNQSLIVPLENATDTKIDEVVTATGLIAHDGDNLKLFPLGTVSVAPTPTATASTVTTRRRITPYVIALAPAGLLSTAVYIGRRRKKKGGDADG